MKYIKILVVFLIISSIDLITHYLIEQKWAGHLSYSFNSLCLFVFGMICLNGFLGWLSLKNYSAKWLLYSWIGLYLLNILYFLFRWGLYGLGLFPTSFLFNGGANLGLSVFVFCSFWLINYFLQFRIRK